MRDKRSGEVREIVGPPLGEDVLGRGTTQLAIRKLKGCLAGFLTPGPSQKPRRLLLLSRKSPPRPSQPTVSSAAAGAATAHGEP